LTKDQNFLLTSFIFKEPKPLEKLPNFPNIYLIKSKDEFASVITSDTEKLLIVHFSAEWCPHFKNVAPKMEELGSKNPNTTAFYTLDIEKIPDIAQLCGVSSIPTFHFFRKKRKITELVGADLEKFELLVKQQLEAALSEQRS
jgi:thioredoxin-like negative regulator of GroEL